MGILARLKAIFTRRKPQKRLNPVSTPVVGVGKPEIKVTVAEGKLAAAKTDGRGKAVEPASGGEAVPTPVSNQISAASKVEAQIATPIQQGPYVIAPLKIEPQAKTEIQLLNEEYKCLVKDKDAIREEMVELDRKLSSGKLTPSERDRLFRDKMVRVVGIAQRILEIRSRCAELGEPIEQ